MVVGKPMFCSQRYSFIYILFFFFFLSFPYLFRVLGLPGFSACQTWGKDIRNDLILACFRLLFSLPLAHIKRNLTFGKLICGKQEHILVWWKMEKKTRTGRVSKFCPVKKKGRLVVRVGSKDLELKQWGDLVIVKEKKPIRANAHGHKLPLLLCAYDNVVSFLMSTCV